MFNPRDHLMQIKNRQGSSDYLPVQWRLVWFREACPDGTIETELVHLDLDKETEEEAFVWNNEKKRSEKVVKTGRGVAIFRAIVKDGKGGIATGTKMEKAASFPDWLEKAETGSIGRALAALGYGTQFAPELDEAHRIVDSPVEGNPGNHTASNSHSEGRHATQSKAAIGRTVAQENDSTSSREDGITETQTANVRKLCHHLNKPVPADLAQMTEAAAAELIRELAAEYRARRATANAEQASA